MLLGTAGATGAAVQAIIGYNRAFAGLAGGDDPIAGQAVHGVLVLAPLLVPAVIGLPATLGQSARRPVAIGAVTWIALSAALIAVQGRLELHYLSMLVPPLALLAPAGFVFHLRGGHRVATSGAIMAGLLAAAFAISTLVSTTETAMALDARAAGADRSEAVGAWVDANTAPDARDLRVGQRAVRLSRRGTSAGIGLRLSAAADDARVRDGQGGRLGPAGMDGEPTRRGHRRRLVRAGRRRPAAAAGGSPRPRSSTDATSTSWSRCGHSCATGTCRRRRSRAGRSTCLARPAGVSSSPLG